MLVYEDKSIPDYLNLPNTSPHTPLAGWREPPAAMNLKDLLCSTELFLREKEENKKTNYKVNSIRFVKPLIEAKPLINKYLCLDKSCNATLLL